MELGMQEFPVTLASGKTVPAVWAPKFSNFARARIVLPSGLVAWSSEAVYQAAKHPGDPGLQRRILALPPKDAKALARSVPVDAEWWDQVRLPLMAWVVRQKFAQNRELARLLLATGERYIVEPSRHDRFWGAAQVGGRWVGKNWLGRILMQVRRELAQGRLQPGRPPVPLP